MWSLRSWIVLGAILLAGSSLAQNAPTISNLNEGETLYLAIFQIEDVVKCSLETPEGKIIEFKPNNESTEKYELLPDLEYINCRANVNNVDVNDNGIWKIHAEFTSGDPISQSYELTVTPKQEDIPTTEEIPATIESDEPLIENLPTLNINANIGQTYDVIIAEEMFEVKESCSLLTPSGVAYNLDTLSISGMTVLTRSEIACGLSINVESIDLVGQWTLIFKGVRYSTDNVEKRKQFNILVEAMVVNASINEVTLIKGNDLYVRLKNRTTEYETCKLLRPNGNEVVTYERDTRYIDTCGFIVKHVNTTDNGTWQIAYVDRIPYKAPFRVLVHDAEVSQESNLVWVRDRPVQAIVGPENVIYCKIENPEGFTVFDSFGRCNITLSRASTEHSGTWKMTYGLSGKVLTEDTVFTVSIVEAEPKPVVTTDISVNKPTVSLSCSVSSPYPLSSCKFRNPSGQVLLANEGVGESRFTFHGAGVSYESGLHTHECGLLITDPLISDLGLWRCGLDTEHETYYGFLTVLCPFAMSDPEVAAEVVTEPVLAATQETVSGLVGDSVTMSCSVQSAIRYCYFRARNGSVFNVGPEQSHESASYFGAGFDAGDCGITFPTLAASDTGAWSCHVGFPEDRRIAEQRASISVIMHDPITVTQHTEHSRLLVEGQVYNNRELEYCRFVRIDGLGFVVGSSNMPEEYISTSSLSTGKCGISIRSPTTLDNHPWTIVARIRGQDVELSRSTTHSLEMPVEAQPDDVNTAHPPGDSITIYYGVSSLWIIIMAIGLIMIFIAAFMGPKHNRDWTIGRAVAVRNSFRDKFSKQAVPDQTKNTAMAA